MQGAHPSLGWGRVERGWGGAECGLGNWNHKFFMSYGVKIQSEAIYGCFLNGQGNFWQNKAGHEIWIEIVCLHTSIAHDAVRLRLKNRTSPPKNTGPWTRSCWLIQGRTNWGQRRLFFWPFSGRNTIKTNFPPGILAMLLLAGRKRRRRWGHVRATPAPR